MKSIDDVLKSRVEDFDMERGDSLAGIQDILNKNYMGRVRAKKIKDGLLTITTPSSVVANELRLAQVKIKKQLKDYGVEEVRIQIN